MRIVSFNINGVRARPHQLEAVVEQLDPDIIGLQETKVHDDQFPHALFEHLGYHIDTHGQKGHYGVAMLSKQPPAAIRKGWVDDGDDAQKRIIMGDYLMASGETLTVINGYFPQGESVNTTSNFQPKPNFTPTYCLN